MNFVPISQRPASRLTRASMLKRMQLLLLAVAFAYLLILLIFRLFEHRLIFFPDYPSRFGGDWQPKGLPVEEVWLRAADG